MLHPSREMEVLFLHGKHRSSGSHGNHIQEDACDEQTRPDPHDVRNTPLIGIDPSINESHQTADATRINTRQTIAMVCSPTWNILMMTRMKHTKLPIPTKP
jgi:hypothetical protein